MTLRMYAERKGLALQNVEVRLSHARIHARDCEDCETKDGMLDEIHSEIVLHGDLAAAQRKRLMEIATLCQCTELSLPRSRSGPPRSRQRHQVGHRVTGRE